MINYNESYYDNYFRKNYNAKIRSGEGIEDCFAWAAGALRPGQWLDVGAGPCSFFWASAAPFGLTSITLTDVSEIPLEITRN